jgi:hypothetical protein
LRLLLSATPAPVGDDDLMSLLNHERTAIARLANDPVVNT